MRGCVMPKPLDELQNSHTFPIFCCCLKLLFALWLWVGLFSEITWCSVTQAWALAPPPTLALIGPVARYNSSTVFCNAWGFAVNATSFSAAESRVTTMPILEQRRITQCPRQQRFDILGTRILFCDIFFLVAKIPTNAGGSKQHPKYVQIVQMLSSICGSSWLGQHFL